VDNADRLEFANVVLNNAKSVVEALNSYDKRLNDITEQTLNETQTTVDRVNAIFAEMASLNDNIKSSYVSMGNIGSSGTKDGYMVESMYGPLELKDRMNLLLDELSQYGNVAVKEQYDGTYTVSFADQVVVNRKQYAQMAIAGDQSPVPKDMGFVVIDAGTYDDKTNLYSGLMDKKQWAEALGAGTTAVDYVRNTGVTVYITDKNKLTSGSLRGYLDMYNGNGAYSINDGAFAHPNTYQGIEYYRSAVNALAVTFAEEFNNAFGDVVDGNGDPIIELFDWGGNFDEAAKNLRVSQTWIDNPAIIAFPNGRDELTALDNTYINRMLGVFDSKHIYPDGAFSGFSEPGEYSFMDYVTYFNITKLAGQISYETGVLTAEEIMLTGVSDARDEVSGVSIEEEGINMVNYQKWYNAVSRMISTMDEMLDRLINGTGRVGL